MKRRLAPGSGHRMAMVTLLMGALCTEPVAGQTARDTAQSAAEQRRAEERNTRLREQAVPEREARLESPGAAAAPRLPSDESPCFVIEQIDLRGESVGQFGWVLDALTAPDGLDGPLRRCLGAAGVAVLVQRAQHALVARGFVTSRVLVEPQDLKRGRLALTVVPGRIREVQFAKPEQRHASARLALPAQPGDLLNLRDIEQALENFKRVPGVEVDIQIVPADEPSLSDLVIEWTASRPVRLQLSVDDSGSRSTGRNPLRLNDLFYVGVQSSLGGGDPGARGTRGGSLHYSLPWGRALLAIDLNRNRYHQTVAGDSLDYIYRGNTGSQEVTLSYLAHRNAMSKTTLHAKAFARQSRNFIDDTEVEVQRRRVDIGAQHITNREGALIFSAGDMAIGGALDANHRAVTDGSANAQTLNNNSATIESLGAMTLVANTLRNTNEHLVVAEVEQTPAQHIVEYQGHNAGSGARFKQGTPGVSVGWQTMPTSKSVLYILNTPEYSGFGGGFDNPWTEYNYTRRTFVTTVTETAPARLVAGGDLRIDGQSVLNDASHILAGGQLSFSQAGLVNTAINGQEVEVDTGEAILYWRAKRSGKDTTGSASSPISETRTRTFELVVDRVEENTTPTGSGITIGALTPTGAINTSGSGNGSSAASTLASLPGQAPAAAVGTASTAPSQSAPSLVVPGSSLFKVIPGSSAGYLVDTDPRFANYRQWLSSDFMLQALAIDPATAQKRLGDGFYEQKLIREQVASLTGYRFLGDYRNDEQQYMALMNAGATFAQHRGQCGWRRQREGGPDVHAGRLRSARAGG